jgi:hypothetical protein
MAVVLRCRADRMVSAALLVLLPLVSLVIAAAPARARPVYRPPVEGTVTDPFRPPPHRFGPGNRGIDYAVTPLTPVRASAAGEVIFAGPVAGTLHVTIRHPDRLRTSYSFLASVTVTVGQVVGAGDEIGRTTDVFHFGVREPAGTYLDPALLFAEPARAHLVPGGDDGTAPTGPEESSVAEVIAERRGALEAVLSRGIAAPASGPLPTLIERTRLWAHLLRESTRLPHDQRMAAGVRRWLAERGRCTPPLEEPPKPVGRRILVEVGGLGSTSEQAAVAHLDTRTLGYADADVVRFSYGGGRVPTSVPLPTAPLGRLTGRSYSATDSQGDLRATAGKLAALLNEVAAAEPGVPVDVVAHSQGGVVARLALEQAQHPGGPAPAVATLVTLGSPHQGADLAAAVQAGRLTAGGRRALSSIRRRLGLELDPELPAAAQLAPVSDLIDELARLPPPPSVRIVSIGARGDVVVPVGRTAIDGVPWAVVTVAGSRAHDRLPGTAEAAREIALAVAGRPPTCRSFTDMVTDLLVGERIARAEAVLGLVVAGATAEGGPALNVAWPDGAGTRPAWTLAGRRAEAIHSSAGPADAGSLRNDIITAALPRSRPACRRSRRAPVSSNRGKETSLWHLS